MKKILLILCLILSSSFGATQKDLAKLTFQIVFENSLSRGFKPMSLKQIADAKDTIMLFSLNANIDSIDKSSKTLIFKFGNQTIDISFDSPNQELSDNITYLFLTNTTQDLGIKIKFDEDEIKKMFNNLTDQYFLNLKAKDNISLICSIGKKESNYLTVINGCFMRDVYLEVSSQVFADSMSQQQLNEYQNAITKSLTPKERQRVDNLDLSTYKYRKAYIISNKLNEVL